ncbi:hypothetical protein H0H81_001790 [Sphagnurus paluster]|uniref:Uncharacterized protein n=1 Tax=Sphagnurus paluster TaxID=117069 RepID=A0A9P7G089_9AGAR|nr:hypothetical protein H0H81_001790 [Sphagnurus paluster]
MPLKERTNLYLDAAAMYQPGAKYTFSTSRATPDPPSSSILENRATNYSPSLRIAGSHRRRLQRYSDAEEELARTFKQCQTEPPARDLQIRALEQATSMLSAHAQEAQESAEKLRFLLSDRSLDPDVYEKLQRERWLEENRHFVVDQETSILLQHLENLTRSSPLETCLLNSERSSEMDEEMRRRRNLLKFFDTSTAQPSVRIRKATSVLFERPQKRRTLDRVSPMRLRTTSTVTTASLLPRPVSLDGWTHRPRYPSHTGLDTAQTPAPLREIAEGPSVDKKEDIHVSTPTTTAVHASFSRSTKSPPVNTSTISNIPQIPSSVKRPQFGDEAGTATIYLNTYTPDLPMDFGLITDVEVPLPDYALELFSRFDYNPVISISHLPTSSERSSDAGPRQSQRNPNAVPKRHSSPFLQVPSVATPTHQQNQKTPRLGRAKSYRQLGSLFSIPEALSSRTGVEFTDRSARRRDDIVSSALSSAASLSPPTPAEGREGFSSKLKKRLSVLRSILILMTSPGPPPAAPVHLLRTHSSPVTALSISSDNERIYSGDASGFVVVTSTRSLRPITAWNAHTDSLLGVEEWGDYLITYVLPKPTRFLHLTCLLATLGITNCTCGGMSRNYRLLHN